MALTRKLLTALGIDADKVDEIINAHSETVEALKKERDGYKTKASEYDTMKAEYDSLKAEADKAKKDPYKVKYEALKEEFDAFKADTDKKNTIQAKEAAYKAILSEIGVSDKRIASILKVTDLDSHELGEDGKFKDADALKKSAASEWSDFIVKTEVKGADTANPPSKTGGSVKTKEQIMAIKDTAERQKAMIENKDLFL